MRIDVSARNMDLTDAIDQYATTKCEKLPKFFNGVQSIEAVLESPKEARFFVEVRVDVVKHDTFVSHEEGDDIYACIDEAVEKMSRQLKDFKERLKAHR